jgi:hypothetical protein
MRALFGAALLSCAAMAMRADVGPLIVEPAAGQRVAAGDVVHVRWGNAAVAADGRAAVEEQELLLSLDGGRHFRLVTRRLDPSARDYVWVVPQLPSGEAILALRVGGEDGEDGEVLAGQSAAFTIAAGSAEARSAETAVASEETWAPLPDGWEGPVPLSERKIGAAWAHARRRRAKGVVNPRVSVVDPTKIATFLESPRPPSTVSVAERPASPPSDYPRRP